MEDQPQIGRITVAPEVLETIARLTTLAVPGVARMASPQGVRRLVRRDGVKLDIVGNSVRVELHIVTEPDVNMLGVSHQIQTEVTRAIQDMVGMQVQSVDVRIEDVACPSGAA
ncbi:MAG: hypothetical protein DRJ03_18775 [Chloroflexi bacterium]|nr:MAG: hypothetical protein B6I35_09585 [Anaerolineaceae bacterium 4572_32.2]RLC74134.1 MAG: hypothetical protein DRI81_14310 [Chloroflexota bacterium]RLC82600.1 MAG: hypothetical protein DRJ03_18775 [Chloroflexota bacterium]HEY73835.1 Asp23/Gls24 family envelope stress response protein [Thermoflexia bacterium]